ncbi:MAG: hypothetical protein WAW61_03335 [Methylococcaceae bacterium]
MKIQQSKVAAYGAQLSERWKFSNPPSLIIVCVGRDDWVRAKKWNSHAAFAALVLTPDQNPKALTWQVKGIPCLIEWNTGPGEALIIDLVKVLLRSGAQIVTVSPLFVDFRKPAIVYDLNRPFGDRFVTVRESLKTYKLRRLDAS